MVDCPIGSGLGPAPVPLGGIAGEVGHLAGVVREGTRHLGAGVGLSESTGPTAGVDSSRVVPGLMVKDI